MKKLIFLFFCLFTQPLFSQGIKDATIFHRLLIFNSKQELMVVKVKNSEFWVTPGIYQNNHQLIREGLDSLASTYGITITRPTLRGIFTLKSELDSSISIRNIFVSQMNGGIIKNPEIIEEVRWLPVNKAMEIITFPHINLIINQVTQYPNDVWGGSLSMYKEGKEYKSRILEKFYPLYTTVNNKTTKHKRN